MKPYMCPYCKTKYKSEDDAKKCLAGCLERNEVFVTTVQCPFCNSEYDSLEDAAGCAENCYLNNHCCSLATDCPVATCASCACATESGHRVYPCPHRQSVNPPDACAAYDPDVRALGTGIATEYTHMLLTHSAAQVAECAIVNISEG